MTDPNFDFDNMSQADFEEHLPEFFANQTGSLFEDPRLKTFLAAHPDCAALVRDLESIADAAKALIDVEAEEIDPDDDLWIKIKSRMAEDPSDPETGVPPGVIAGTQTESGPLSLKGEPDQLVTGGSLHDLE
ncbi:hypothetical protein [Granulicella sibirica]|uniref:Uncharacterized protein n=1 Tax=Granulicella sibirica TaxID=2479048 RepID=A0A4Q0T0E0_9BACT|nr:hypothetical protein [Granulicella sibirica]RXH57025.1 hypothetical protein GRAN_0335 [Granulicella sibirica]